ncbi:BnaC09g37400D [Brassica napus]|uniref:BnaC09g37400D protein n=1 Tax=Brassica napus TaxID=3708 RepID=A0A078HG61_BRANA|nr:BnaC09g37400D [Brassica napus]
MSSSFLDVRLPVTSALLLRPETASVSIFLSYFNH